MNKTTISEPFRKFVGNARAKKRLARVIHAAKQRRDRNCADFPFAIIGAASTGKTMLARAFAEEIDLPFIEIQPQAVQTVHDVLMAIDKVCEDGMVEDADGNYVSTQLRADIDGIFHLPPMVVFFDEVHNLPKKVVQGLLKAVERSDCEMVTEKDFVADTSKVCWVIATTDRGDLFDAFDTRFTKIKLRLYSRKEIAQIVKYGNKEFPDEVCHLVSKYCGFVPREALAFAREMRLEQDMTGAEWVDCARVVAEDNAIDPLGMTYQRLELLKALGQRPIAANRLALIGQCKLKELTRFVMPPLLAITPDQKVPLVTVTTKGYTITPQGLKELQARDIDFNANTAVPDAVRQQFR